MKKGTEQCLDLATKTTYLFFISTVHTYLKRKNSKLVLVVMKVCREKCVPWQTNGKSHLQFTLTNAFGF